MAFKGQVAQFGAQTSDMLERGATPKAVSAITRKANTRQRKLLEKGKAYHLKEDWRNALKYYDEAWGNDPENLDLLTLVAYCLTQLDARSQAMDVVERALKIHGANEILCQILGILATKMFFHEIAAKLWRQAIALNPQNGTNYVNLLGAMYQQGQFEEVVQVAQDVLPLFPQESNLWSILATSIQYTEHASLAPQFFEEALKWDPRNIRALNNYSMNIGCTVYEALPFMQRALEVEPENPEVHLGIANYYFVRKELDKAWAHYEYRLSPNRAKGQDVRYIVPYPAWDEKPDAKKAVFVKNEQGIGDEILLLRMLEKLVQDVGQVLVGCDFRLQQLIERSYPGVIAVPHNSIEKLGFITRTYPGLAPKLEELGYESCETIAMGSLWRVYAQTIDTIPRCPNGYVKPDPERVDEIARFFPKSRARKRIGVSWQSGNVSKLRQDSLMDVEVLVGLFADMEADLYVLQYAGAEQGVAQLRAALGEDRVITFDGIDLKMDIEANYAIHPHLDFVVGPGVATQMFAISSGTRVGMLAHGRPWWNFSYGFEEDGVVIDQDYCAYIPNLRWLEVEDGGMDEASLVRYRAMITDFMDQTLEG